MGGRRMNINTEFGVRTPSTTASERDLIDRKILPPVPERGGNKDFIGIEIEIEGIEPPHQAEIRMHTLAGHTPNWRTLLCWDAKADGSLRNRGVEFVSKAIHASSAPALVESLLAFLRGHYANAVFSERCGIHVHFDITRLDIKQLLWFTLLYIIYEEDIFKYADVNRKDSNFCVPLRSQTPWDWFPRNLGDWGGFHAVLPNNDRGKYSAMNFCRVRDIGTVEFRHMPGTWDANHIVTFIKMIQAIKETALNSKLHENLGKTIEVANTTSCYRQLTDEIFKDLSYKVCPDDDSFQSVEAGISFVKKFQWMLEFGDELLKPVSIMASMKNQDFTQKFSKFVETKKQMRRGPGREQEADDPNDEQRRVAERNARVNIIMEDFQWANPAIRRGGV